MWLFLQLVGVHPADASMGDSAPETATNNILVVREVKRSTSLRGNSTRMSVGEGQESNC